MAFLQKELDEMQPNDYPFCVILDDGENDTVTFFTKIRDAEAYNDQAPIESRVYIGRSVDFSLYS